MFPRKKRKRKKKEILPLWRMERKLALWEGMKARSLKAILEGVGLCFPRILGLSIILM